MQVYYSKAQNQLYIVWGHRRIVDMIRENVPCPGWLRGSPVDTKGLRGRFYSKGRRLPKSYVYVGEYD